jgi:hypothetical protein
MNELLAFQLILAPFSALILIFTLADGEFVIGLIMVVAFHLLVTAGAISILSGLYLLLG